MPQAAKRICTHPGCYTITTESRCERHKKEHKTWAKKKRETTAERGYDNRWTEASKSYRRENPLCVPCQLRDRITATECVDHIIPRHSCEELFWDRDNWCSCCWYCHGVKTKKEPQTLWIPRKDRVVICGLPGTGKTTHAKEIGQPFWDADDYDYTTIEQIQTMRSQWVSAQRGAFTVIVASPLTASLVACSIGGVVKHMTQQWVRREIRSVVDE